MTPTDKLPTVDDKASDGKKKPFKYTCYNCAHFRRCARSNLTTENSRTCAASPSKFKPHSSVPYSFDRVDKKKKRRPLRKVERPPQRCFSDRPTNDHN